MEDNLSLNRLLTVHQVLDLNMAEVAVNTNIKMQHQGKFQIKVIQLEVVKFKILKDTATEKEFLLLVTILR